MACGVARGRWNLSELDHRRFADDVENANHLITRDRAVLASDRRPIEDLEHLLNDQWRQDEPVPLGVIEDQSSPHTVGIDQAADKDDSVKDAAQHGCAERPRPPGRCRR